MNPAPSVTMFILRADTGQAIVVEISPSASVQTLRESIASQAPISPQDQILLLNIGKRLDANKTLEYYGLPSKDKEVFLFNRRAVMDPNYPIEDCTPPLIDTQVPQIRPLSKEFEGKPLFQALKTYEHQFHSHFLIAQAIRVAVEKRFDSCKMCFSEVHVQVRGIECAILNLNDHMGQLTRTHEDFTARAKLQIMESDELLDNFDTDLATLREVHIHPSLAAPGTTLLDRVPENTLRTWAKDGRSDNDHVKMRIPDMENQLRQLQSDVDAEIKKPNDVDLRELSERMFHSEEVLKDVITKLQMFTRDYENVHDRVEFVLRSSQGQNLGNFCDGYDEISKVHEAHLAYLRAQDEASKENFLVFARCKTRLSRVVYARIRSVSLYQARIRESHNTMTVMGEALARLRAAFAQLAIVKNMPRAYQAAIQEVARRRGFAKKLRRELLRMNETITKMRDEEVPKRDSFVNKYFYNVPKDLVPGLQDPLPPLEITLPAFDMSLPQIDSTSTSGEVDDFTMVPFGDEMPRMPSFDSTNAFSQGSNNYSYQTPNPPSYHHPTTTNPTNPPITALPPTTNYNPPNIPTSNPIPITSTKGFNPPAHTSSGQLSVSPGSDVVKLQKDLAAAKEVSSNYADRIKHLEGELNKLYKEKIELTQHTQISGGPRFEVEMRNILTAKEETIRAQKAELESLKVEMDTMREKERSEREEPDPEVETLRSKIFEQEKQIERLMIAIHTPPEPLVVSARAQTQTQGETQGGGEAKRLASEIEEWKKRAAEWEVERREAKERYDGMFEQLTGEMDHLRKEKLDTSRSWNNEKQELDKAQKTMDKMKETFAAEKTQLETTIKDLEETLKTKGEEWEKQKGELEEQLTLQQATAEQNREAWTKEKETMAEVFEKEKQVLAEDSEKRESQLRRDIDNARSEVEKLQKKLETLQTEATDLRENLTSTSKTLKEKEQAVSELEKTKKELFAQVADLEANLEKQSKTSTEIAKELEDSVRRADVLQKKVEEIQNNNKDTNARKEALEEYVKNMKSEKQEISEKLAHTQTTLTAELESLNLTLRASDAALAETTTNLKAASAKLADREEELSKTGKELRAARTGLEARELEAREREEKITSLENIIREKDALLREKEAALREKDAVFRATETALREKDAALRASEAALRDKDAAVSQSEEMSRSITNLSQLLETKEKGYNDGVLDYEKKLAEMEERQKQEEMDRYRMFEMERENITIEYSTRIERLQQQITELQNELKKQDSGPQLLALKNESTQLKATVTGLQNEANQLKGTITALQTQLKDQGIAHTQELDLQTQKHTKKEAEINEISVQIQKKNAVLEKRLQESDEEKRRMQQQLEQAVAAQTKVDQLRKVVTELSANLKNHPACKNHQNESGDDLAQFQTRVSAVIAFAHELEEERDHANLAHVTEASQLRTLLQAKEDRVGDLERRLQDAQGQLTAWEMNQSESVPNKISFSKFKAGDLVLFVPKNKSHEAFNIGSPNYYLSQDCANFYENQTYVCGQIIEIDSRKATARDNPFKLVEGTEFHEVTITSI